MAAFTTKLPNGKTATRNSKTKVYAYAVVADFKDGRCGVWRWSQTGEAAMKAASQFRSRCPHIDFSVQPVTQAAFR